MCLPWFTWKWAEGTKNVYKSANLPRNWTFNPIEAAVFDSFEPKLEPKMLDFHLCRAYLILHLRLTPITCLFRLIFLFLHPISFLKHISPFTSQTCKLRTTLCFINVWKVGRIHRSLSLQSMTKYDQVWRSWRHEYTRSLILTSQAVTVILLYCFVRLTPSILTSMVYARIFVVIWFRLNGYMWITYTIQKYQ